MATSVINEKELLDLEKQYWEAMKRKDGRAAADLCEDPSLVLGPSGIMTVDKKTMADMVENGPFTLNDYKFDAKDVHVQPIGDNVAIVAYKVKENVTTGGKTSDMEAFELTVWVRKNGKWIAGAHAESTSASQ